MIDKILAKIVRNNCPEKEVAVLLSGGVDSLSLAFTAHRLGKKVTAYTFHLKGKPTYDSKKAQEACKVFGWDCVVVEVPTDNVKSDFDKLINRYGCNSKTQVECTFPFLYVYPQIKEKYVLSGIAADGWYILSKKGQIHFKQSKELNDIFRNSYFSKVNPAGVLQQIQLAEEYDKVFVHPYLWNGPVRDFFMQFTWNEMNKPVQKKHVREAFEKEFNLLNKVRGHLNLQLEAGIDDLFANEVESLQVDGNITESIPKLIRSRKVETAGPLDKFFL